MAGVENGWKSLPALEFQDTDSGNMATTIPQRTGKREDQAIATQHDDHRHPRTDREPKARLSEHHLADIIYGILDPGIRYD